MTTKSIKIIRHDGSIEVLEKCPCLKGMQAIVGGLIEHVKVLDRIETTAKGEEFIYTSMFVDDEGLLKAKPHNEVATEIYLRNAREQIKRGADLGRFGTLENLQIVGDALFFEGYTIDEINAAYEVSQKAALDAERLAEQESRR